jgi:hypothetical protein
MAVSDADLFVKTSHVTEVVSRYMLLPDKDLKEMLKPGYGTSEFRYQLHSLSEAVKALDSKISPYLEKLALPVSGASKSSMLWDWVIRSGGEASKVALEPVKVFGRGLRAQGKIYKGDNVVVVDESCVMRLSMALSRYPSLLRIYKEWTSTADSKNYMKNRAPQLQEKAILAMFLLEETAAGASSFFYPYIQLLPEKIEYVPVAWDPSKDAELFQGSHMVPALETRRKEIAEEFARGISTVVPEYSTRFTTERYQWARLIVSTRAFRIFPNGQLTVDEKRTQSENSNIALVPIADLANHHDTASQTDWTYNVNMKAFTMTANMNIRKSEQVFDSYGHKNNFDFLLNFGFTLDNDRNVLYFFIMKGDKGMYVPATRAASRTPSAPSWIQDSGKSTITMKSVLEYGYLRKFLLEASVNHQLFNLLLDLRDSALDDPEWWNHPGQYALTFLNNKLAAMRQTYGTTTEADLESIQDMEARPNDHPHGQYINAYKLRVGEKKVIKWLQDFTRKNLKFYQAFPALSKVVIQGPMEDKQVLSNLMIADSDLWKVEKGDVKIGSAVLSRWQNGRTYYEATVVNVNEDDTVNLFYWDGDKEDSIALKNLAWLSKYGTHRRSTMGTLAEVVLKRIKVKLGNIENDCFTFHKRKDFWSYEFCPGRHISQYHEDPKKKGEKLQIIRLGTYDDRPANSMLKSSSHDAFQDWYTMGDGGRVATVLYICVPSSNKRLRELGYSIVGPKIVEKQTTAPEETIRITIEKIDFGAYRHPSVEEMISEPPNPVFEISVNAAAGVLAYMIRQHYGYEVDTEIVLFSSGRKNLVYDEPLSRHEKNFVFFSTPKYPSGTEYEHQPQYETNAGPSNIFTPPYQGADNRLLNVTEPSAKTYQLVFASPLVCVFDIAKHHAIRTGAFAGFSNPHDSGVVAGDFGHAKMRKKGITDSEYKSGHITSVNADGSLSFQYDNGVYEETVSAQDILVDLK